MEKNKAVHLRLFFTYLLQNLFNIKKHHALVLKKNRSCICTNDTMFWYNKGLDENLAWLTQKTEEPKSNKSNLVFPQHIKCD